MISRWKWMLKQTIKKLWFRATLFAIVAIITALLSILFKSMIPESVSVKVGAEAVDNILNILASSMLAVTTFSLSIMVTAYGSATTNVTPRATRLVVEDVTTQNVLATFIGSSQGGFWGALCATLGVVLPSFVIILLVASVLQNLMKYAGVNAVLGGVRPCVVAMILATAVNMALSTLAGFAADKAGIAPDLRSIVVFLLLWGLHALCRRKKGKAPSPIGMILLSAGLGILFWGI